MLKTIGDVGFEDGLLDLTGNKNYLGNPHINVILDRPVVSHIKDREDDYVRGPWIETPDYRNHSSDWGKLSNHPTYSIESLYQVPGKEAGRWGEGYRTFELSDWQMENPNNTVFGLYTQGDGDIVPTYKGSRVLPAITITPNGNYVYDAYDGNRLEFANGGHLYQKGGGIPTPDWYKDLVGKYGYEYKQWKKDNPDGSVIEFARRYAKPVNYMLDRNNVPGMTPYNSDVINSSVATYPKEETKKKTIKALQDKAQKEYEWRAANTPSMLKAYDEKEHNGTYEQRMNYAEGLANKEKERKINEGTANMMFQLPFWAAAPEFMAAYTVADEAGRFAGEHDKTTSQWINQAMLGEGHDNNILGPVVLGGGLTGLKNIGKTATESVTRNIATRNAFNTSDFAMANDLHFTPTGTLKQGTKAVDLGTGKVQKPTTIKTITDPVAGKEVKPKTLLHNMQKSPEPYINYENATSITPEQWTAAQDAAIARGDMAEAQRLRDLHFKVSTPGNVVTKEGMPIHNYHGTDAEFNTFDINLFGRTDHGDRGKGFYFSENRNVSEGYGPIVKDVYLYGKTPYKGFKKEKYLGRGKTKDEVVEYLTSFHKKQLDENVKHMIEQQKSGHHSPMYDNLGITNEMSKQDIKNLVYKAYNHEDVIPYEVGNLDEADIFLSPYENVVYKPNQIKSADAVTYDNNGVRIPLGERDNFGVNDIRYLKGKDIQGNEYELPVRTMRGGVKDAKGNLITDEMLVANWKRSQDFYKMRLRNKNIQQKGKIYVTDEKGAIEKAQKFNPNLSENIIKKQLDELGKGFANPEQGYGVVEKEINTTGKQRRGTTNSGKVHEDAHLMRNNIDINNMEDITWSKIANIDKDEAAARGSQIKSILGITDDTAITKEQLMYMKENFVRLTGMDNNMQAFLNSITDFESAAKWLSKHSYSLGGALNLLGIIKSPLGKGM